MGTFRWRSKNWSSPARKAGLPIRQTGIKSLRAPPGRPSCDATSTELGKINLITQHDESPHQQAAGNCYLGGGMTTTHQQPAIDLAQLLIMPGRHLTRFHQQRTQESRPLLTDRAHPAPLTSGIFYRIETRISRHLAAIRKPLYRVQRVHQTKPRQKPDAGMCAQPFHP